MTTSTLAQAPFTTVAEAQGYFDSRASLYNSRNIAAIMDGYAEDIEIQYGDVPVMFSKNEYEPFVAKRLASFNSYNLKKIVRLVQGNHVVTELDIHWAGEASQGKPRRTRAFEILTFRGAKLAKWEMVSCAHPGNGNPAAVKHPATAAPFETVEQAQAHFDSRASFYNNRDIAAIMDGYEDDIEIHYGELPVMYSKSEFLPVVEKRLASFSSYDLKKTVRFVQRNLVVTELDIRWAGDASQGQPRRTRAFEIVEFRGKRLAKWEMVSCPRPANLP